MKNSCCCSIAQACETMHMLSLLGYLGDEFVMIGKVSSAVNTTVRAMALAGKISLESFHHFFRRHSSNVIVSAKRKQHNNTWLKAFAKIPSIQS